MYDNFNFYCLVTLANPVFINRLDGHMALANQFAMDLAGVNASTPDVEGGTVVRDQFGNPTGNSTMV